MTDISLSASPDAELYYRYDERRYGDGEGFHSRLEVQLSSYRVLKHTPCGVWIEYSHLLGSKRFVLHAARKKFVHPTPELARISFIARKKRQIKIYQARLDEAKAALALVGG